VELVTAERDAYCINPLNAELKLICHLLTLLGAHPLLHLSRIRVKSTKSLKLGGFPDQVLNPGPHECKTGWILILPQASVIMKMLVIITAI